MDGAHIAGGPAEAGGGSSSVSSASSHGSASRRSRTSKGVHLRPRWRRRVAVTGGGGNKGAGDGDGAVEDLALPLGMSFAAVLAQVLNRCSDSGAVLQPDSLSKMCISAVKESLANIYGDRSESFMRNFEKSFGSTLRTLHLINKTLVCQQDIPQRCYRNVDSISETKLNGADSLRQIHDVQKDMSFNSMDGQIVLHAQQLVHPPRGRSTP